jgi:hypothetical protein
VLEHISEEALKKYKEKTLSSVELLSVGDHLESCLHCREKLAGINPLDNLLISFTSEFSTDTDDLTQHLLPEEVIAYVDNQLDDVDREIADSHLIFCTVCRADIQDLRAFKSSLPVQSVKSTQIEKPSGLWHKFLRFWHQSKWSLAIQAAALATVVLFVITTLSLRREVSDLQNTLGDLRLKNDALQQQIDNIPDLKSQIAQLQLTENPSIVGDSLGNTEPLSDNGRQVAIVQGSLNGIGDIPFRYEQLLKNVLSQEQVGKPTIPKELIIPPKEQLMGNADQDKFFPLLYPTGKIIESDHPTLKWGVLADATSYRVAVYDADSNQVAQSPELSTLTWTLTEPLKRGAIYSWEVTAVKDNIEIIAPSAPVPPAKFKVLEQGKFDELNRAKRTYDSHLLSGTLYMQAGLLDDAEREFKALLAENPKSRLAQKLLRSVQNPKSKSLKVSKPQKHKVDKSPRQAIACLGHQFQELSPTTINPAQ